MAKYSHITRKNFQNGSKIWIAQTVCHKAFASPENEVQESEGIFFIPGDEPCNFCIEELQAQIDFLQELRL